MGIIGLVILSLAFGAVHSSKCEPDTVVCAHHWVKMEPHKNLMEAEEELDSWCRKQSLFFRCLDPVLFCRYGNYSKFPTDMLVSKMFSEDLCLKGSPSRKRYLDNAACINQLDFEHCTMPEYLEIVTPDTSVPPKCSSAGKTFSCIAATMVIKCGFDAGRVYRYLLKVTKYGDEVTGVESLENKPCDEETDSDEDKLSEIYYGLVHRFGSIPEQATEYGSVIETASVAQSESGIFEALKENTIDYTEGTFEPQRSTLDTRVSRNEDESRKRPVIIEQFKGLLFYNYSDQDFEFYWRQPGSFPIERVTCEHAATPHIKGFVFECLVHHRSKEPECYYITKPTTNEKLTPELIRDIDTSIPEDSTLDIRDSVDLESYLPEYQKYRMKWLTWVNTRLILMVDGLSDINRKLVEKYPNHKVCAKELRYFDIINEKYIHWWQCPSLFSEELRNEIVTFLYGKRTVDDVLFLTVVNENDKSYVHLYEPLLHAFDKVTCERVNECHPRGRGVFKCSFKRRDLEGCKSCCKPYLRPGKCPRDIDSSDGGSGVLGDAPVHSLENEEATRTVEPTDFATRVVGENEDALAHDMSDLQSDSNSQTSSDVNILFASRNSDASGEDTFLARSGIFVTSDGEAPHDELSEHGLELLNGEVLVLKAAPTFADFETAYELVSEDDMR